MIYLDNAATSSPKPKMVANALFRAASEYSANPGRSGHSLSQAAAEEVYKCRSKVAGYFSVPQLEQVIFTKNCTEAINMTLKGYLNPGDHVITSSLEHNAVMRPLHKLMGKGITFETAEVLWGDDDGTVRSFERLIKPETKLIICTHASNVLGIRLPIEKIAKICREHEIAFAVDAAQSAGVLPVNVSEMGIDFLCVAPHKGLYAPMGTGILIAGKKLETLQEGGTGTASVYDTQPEELPERFESGTLNLPGIMGISAGLDFVQSRTPARIHSHEMTLVRALYRRLSKIPGIRLYTEEPNEQQFVAVLSFNIRETSSEEVAFSLDRAGFAVRAGLHCAPSAHKRIGTLSQGTVRVCPSAFTTMQEMDKFANYIDIFSKNYHKNH